MTAESEEIDLRDSLARFKDVSNRIFQREIQALSIFNSLDNEQEIALIDSDYI